MKIKIPEQYYNGENLLNQLDKNEEKPGIYLSNSNRSAGKTSFFQIYCIDKFLEKREQFILLCRQKNELDGCELPFDDVMCNYFEGMLLSSKWYVTRLVMGIWLDGKLCGFAISLKDANKLKKYSSIFSKVSSVIMDELQPETGAYLHDEVDLFTSIVQSVSRGGGKQSRYVTWCLLGNNISVMNPYFLNLGVYKYIDDTLDLKEGEDFYIKGEGWVCEFSYNKSAKEEMEKNPAIRAFTSRNSILGLTVDFMIKSSGFIEKKVKGKMDYLFTLKYKGEFMGVRRVKASGIIYVTSSYDPSFKHTVAISDSDHDDATIKLRKNTFYIQTLRDAYTIAKLRFSDFKTKNAIVELLGIDYYRE